jgi:hypothetical protein
VWSYPLNFSEIELAARLATALGFTKVNDDRSPQGRWERIEPREVRS